MPLLPTPPLPMRLKPLAWSILLALASPAALAEGEARSAAPITPNMGPIEIELPEGYEEELGKAGTSQKGLQVLEALEVKGEWEDKDEKGRSDVYRKDISSVYAGKEEIERYKGANVADLFKGLNGVYSGDSRNSGALDPNIRGLQGEGRIPVTVDGTEQSTSYWMGAAGVSNRNYVDPNMIGSIAVEKGPSLNPDVKSGIGGSVQIKTLDVDDIVRPGETYGVEIKSETATNAVKPNEDGTHLFGKDYRDIDGAYSSGGAVIFSQGGGPQFTPHESPRYNDFDFEDNAFRIAAGARYETFDLFAAYSYRDRGNYYSGKGGSQRYETRDWLDKASAEQNNNASGGIATRYVANLFQPGNEVASTSSEMRTTLLKGTLYMANEQSLKLSYMRSDLEFGETSPFYVSEAIRLGTEVSSFGLELPRSEVKQNTYALDYKWSPEDNNWVDLKAGFWMTQSDSRRHQSGDTVYGVAEWDWGWDKYVQCQNNSNLGQCAGGAGTAPEKLPNTDGRYNIVANALQVTRHDRWGINISNRIALSDNFALTVSGDFNKEKLDQSDYATLNNNGNISVWATRYIGPRSGEREQYNFSFDNEWAATSWLVFNAGARYSDYNAFDTGLAEHRANQDAEWDAKAPIIGRSFDYYEIMSDAENKAYVDGVRSEVESWGIDDPALVEELVGIELQQGLIDGVRYTQKSVIIPSDGVKLDSAANPFTNGSINLNEQVGNAQGTGSQASRYITGNAYGTEVKGEISEEARWAKPKKSKASAWAPMAGVTLHLTDHARVYARYSESVRFPTVYEASSAYSLRASAPVRSSVKPEHAYNWEVGYVHDLRGFLPRWRHADFRINYYNNQIHDYIDRDYSYNIIQFDKKEMSGLELQTRFDTGRYFSNFGVSYRLEQKMCDKDYAASFDPYYGNKVNECVTGGFPTTFARTSLQPQYSINADAGLRLFDERLELGGRMVYHSSAKNKDEAKWLKQGVDYTLTLNEPYEWHPIWVFDAYASLRVTKSVDVDFGINNITNRYYLDPMARAMVPAPGRTMKFGVTARF